MTTNNGVTPKIGNSEFNPLPEEAWQMAGTEETYEYVGLARTQLGYLGVRDLGGKYRIRLEPYPGGAEEIAKHLTRALGWKQPGDGGEERFSIVVEKGARFHMAIALAIVAMQAYVPSTLWSPGSEDIFIGTGVFKLVEEMVLLLAEYRGYKIWRVNSLLKQIAGKGLKGGKKEVMIGMILDHEYGLNQLN